MCVIIYRPAGTAITSKLLAQCWEHHNDGGGYMYAKDGILYWSKGFFDKDEFIETVLGEINENPDVDFGIHLRRCTHGEVTTDNCHPFIIQESVGMMHNGVVNPLKHTKEKRSDSRIFAEDYLEKLPAGFIREKAIMQLIEWSTQSSKFLFMDNEGYVTVIREKSGIWLDGIWLSNGFSHLPVPRVTLPIEFHHVSERWHRPVSPARKVIFRCMICGYMLAPDEVFVCKRCKRLHLHEQRLTCSRCKKKVRRDTMVSIKSWDDDKFSVQYLCQKCFNKWDSNHKEDKFHVHAM